ncbi:bacteriocin-like protein [Chryseobacterium oryctis]|uniref:Bacteriocin-type signal sequence-containing protein n=1 Tax=Chryseobacterium oryctis TaxID=2952618 RepID=A0ABT3HNY6_9FLAO|nr:hypothetical protein [Chryseobacterium oryctis]MCW3161499.1 hypothetical protein [Chryseobacterium oryctis]
MKNLKKISRDKLRKIKGGENSPCGPSPIDPTRDYPCYELYCEGNQWVIIWC